MEKTYTIVLHKEEECYWAQCKEIKSCFAQANTVEELKELMINSILLYSEQNT